MKKIVAVVMVICVLAMLLVVISILFHPEWLKITGGIATLAVVALVVVLGLGEQINGWLDLLFPNRKHANRNPGVTTTGNGPVQINQGNSKQNVQVVTYVDKQFVAAPVAPPTPQGFIPAANVETYIPRGDIEQQVRERLSKRGVAAIVGVHAPGGVGKTELARRAATDLKSQFDSVLWFYVGGKTPQQVIGDMALECGLNFLPTLSYDQQVVEVKSFLQQHSVMVVLDDVRAANANSLADFLPPSPPCAALVTSRIRQFAPIPVMATFELGRMSQEQALALLEAVLTPGGVQAENRAAKELMERCAFNPLALDIAARRILQFAAMPNPIDFFLQKLRTRLSELQVGDDLRLNLMAVFDISYDDLSPEDQRRYRRLAGFDPGGFSPAAVARVWGEPLEGACLALARLFNLSLVKMVESTRERYRLHDLLFEHAGGKLEACKEVEETKRVHADYLMALFNQHYRDNLSNAPEVADDLDNLRFIAAWALAQGEGDLLGRLATAPRNWLYNIFRAWEDWQTWLAAALKLGMEDQQTKANVLQAMGDVQQFRAERDAALESYAQALGLFRAVGSKLGEANVLLSTGGLKSAEQDLVGARSDYESALQIYLVIGDSYSQARALYRLGDCAGEAGEWSQALGHFQQAEALWKSIDMSDLAEQILAPRIQAASQHL